MPSTAAQPSPPHTAAASRRPPAAAAHREDGPAQRPPGAAARQAQSEGGAGPAEAAPAEAAPAGPASFTLDSGRSSFRVRTYKGGVGSGLAHDHAIAADEDVVREPRNPVLLRELIRVHG